MFLFAEVATPTHQVTLEISKQAPDTPPPSMHQPGPAYENVVRKLSFHSDEEEGFFELDIEQEAYWLSYVSLISWLEKLSLKVPYILRR